MFWDDGIMKFTETYKKIAKRKIIILFNKVNTEVKKNRLSIGEGLNENFI